ncbi:MAG TPA: L-threonylcarbamoyladenylate synthase [Dehalococcoidia bacterium]|nr:L-threonylcarbamoyladenylate synthase [Dehalococcoidia bacterium]
MTIPAALDQVGKAVSLLRNGGVISMPTDTLYALTAAADDATAVRRVFEIKGRQQGRPLPLFVSGLESAERIAELNETARRLASQFWPGQLTIVVSKRQTYESEALAGSATVGLRVPDNQIARAVIEALGAPVTGTSANLSGGPDPVTAADVRSQLGDRVDLILDAGPCARGIGSTIVDCSGDEPVILREGAISSERVFAALRD